MTKTHLIPFRIGIQWIFSSQHSRREHDTKENHISEDTVIAQPMTKYTKSEKVLSVNYFDILSVLNIYTANWTINIDTQLLQLNGASFIQTIFL